MHTVRVLPERFSSAMVESDTVIVAQPGAVATCLSPLWTKLALATCPQPAQPDSATQVSVANVAGRRSKIERKDFIMKLRVRECQDSDGQLTSGA
ncbi:hypothetical protein FJTKL_13718 [Diaporthe vaccinii]|uniref:Uncharacterized protein n=1 Tax=Diaporthe vaccinii TaxID=105482 RepID=A0ABR4E9N5_9PEZI